MLSFNANFFKGNNISAVFALIMLAVVALACGGGEKPSAPPTESELQTLVKNTVSDFADGVDKNDFTTLRANASKELQSQTTEEQMKTAFKTFTDQKEAMLPILHDAAKKNIVFSPTPAVRDENGYSVITTNGTIASDPQPVKVTNDYVYQDGKWKLLKVNIVITP